MKNITSRVLMIGFLAAALIACSENTETGENNDSKAVDFSVLNFVVPSSVGGGSDLYARQIIPHMARELGVRFAIQNLPGDGTLRGVTQAANADPDGATLTTFNPPSITTAQMQRGDNSPVDIREMTYIGQWGTSSMVLFVSNDYPHRTITDIIDHYQEGDARILGIQERGGISTLLAALVRDRWDWNWKNTAIYDGGGELVSAVTRNEVSVGITTDDALFNSAVSGHIIPIAVFSAERSMLLPDVPTAEEVGMPDISFAGSVDRVVAGPPNMDDHLRQKLQDALEVALSEPQVKEWAENTGVGVAFESGDTARKNTLNSFQIQEIPNIEEILYGQ